MRLVIIFFVIINSVCSTQAQELSPVQNKKGDFFMYWGWNRGAYSTSDIRFSGQVYDFTIQDAIAHDRQTPFNTYDYFHPLRITIPQFNARVGYFVSDNYSVSIGADHMKYVVDSNQVITMNGYIQNSGTDYDGVYEDERVILSSDLLLL